MKRIRAFLAVNTSLDMIERLRDLQHKLRPKAQAAGLTVAWVPPPNMHVTLKFLAEIPEESVYSIADLLREQLASRNSFSLTVRGVGAFPSPLQPRVIWVGLHGLDEVLEKLAQDIDQCLSERLGFAPETRPFRAHLTLGRVKQGQGDFINEFAGIDLGTCVINEVVLYQSVLQRSGAEYRALARIPLGSTPLRTAPTEAVGFDTDNKAPEELGGLLNYSTEARNLQDTTEEDIDENHGQPE